MWRISRLGAWIVLLAMPVPARAAFELVARGARTEALGGAFTAGVDAAETVWYNPAGSARTQKWSVGTMHALLFPELADSPMLSGLAATGPLGGGNLQLGLSGLSADDWDEKVAVIGYGRPVHQRVAVGGSLRTRSWSTTGLSRRSWSADLGGTYEVGWLASGIYTRLALVLRNLNGANIAAGGQAAGETPRGLVLAASFDLGEQQFLFDVERRAGATQIRAGYETRTVSLNGARLRIGASSLPGGWEGKELDVGIGQNWGPWQFDYAYAHPLLLNGLGGMHRLSIGYRQR